MRKDLAGKKCFLQKHMAIAPLQLQDKDFIYMFASKEYIYQV